jgi:hypothetical protein
MDEAASGDDTEEMSHVEKRQMAYGLRDQLGLELKTLVIVTYSMAAVGVFPSTMTISEVFVEDEKHEEEIIDAAAAFCKIVTGYPPSDIFFSEDRPSDVRADDQ